MDCNGFCSYCYFRGVKSFPPFGCKFCMPFKKGCDYCSRAISESYPGFKPMDAVLFDVASKCMGSIPDKVSISGGGDLSCYPDLLPLTRSLSQGMVPVSLGYTSGKGFKKADDAADLVEAGVMEVSFTVFATDPSLRKKYMNDKNAEIALSNLEIFCQSCQVYCAAVLIPGINDGEVLEKTCSDLEDMGAKGIILMRFANSRDQGLILGNAPILPGIVPHSIEEFRDIVTETAKGHRLRVTGTPLWDPVTGAPFALARHPEMVARLPEQRRGATVITSRAALPLLRQIFKDRADKVNVVALDKDIGCLITIEDFQNMDLATVKDTVIIPGRTMAHEKEIKKALCRDGRDRMVARGPDRLTVDGEMSISMSEEEVLDLEMEAFGELIAAINALGV